MALLAFPSAPAPATCSWRGGKGKGIGKGKWGFEVRAFFPNPISTQQPILKEALKLHVPFREEIHATSLGLWNHTCDEPVAFVGGIFAGLLRLDLKEEPLREWVARTVEASGITTTTTTTTTNGEREGEEGEEEPLQQIEIE